jgi:hypothetical protein
MLRDRQSGQFFPSHRKLVASVPYTLNTETLNEPRGDKANHVTTCGGKILNEHRLQRTENQHIQARSLPNDTHGSKPSVSKALE